MRWLVAVVLALSLAGPVTLSAQQAKKGKGQPTKGQPTKEQPTKDQPTKGQPKKVTVVLTGNQRDAVRSYFVEKYGRGNCPPGLAKKDNGCLPPGQAKKRYVVGRSLPSGIVVAAVPADLSVRLGAAPAGYRYGILDGDLLMIAVGTTLVVDAIESLVR